MHQTGLYNRQFKLWKTLGNITKCSFYSLKKGLIKKNELGIYTIDFFVDPKSPCSSAIIHKNKKGNNDPVKLFYDLKTYILKTTFSYPVEKLKGVFYFISPKPKGELLHKLKQITRGSDLISKYESILSWSKDTRLNLIVFKGEDNKYTFEPIYPEIKR